MSLRSPLQVHRCLAALDEFIDGWPGKHGRTGLGHPSDVYVVGAHDLRTSLLILEYL